jgi:hypothetical protein
MCCVLNHVMFLQLVSMRDGLLCIPNTKFNEHLLSFQNNNNKYHIFEVIFVQKIILLFIFLYKALLC